MGRTLENVWDGHLQCFLFNLVSWTLHCLVLNRSLHCLMDMFLQTCLFRFASPSLTVVVLTMLALLSRAEAGN